MDKIVELARKTIKETYEFDKNQMSILYSKFSVEEELFIDEFMKKFDKYKDYIIFNEKSGCINFCYKAIQIGRIRLNSKKRKMQVLTLNRVEWIDNITLEEAINNLDKWLEYLELTLKQINSYPFYIISIYGRVLYE